MKRRLGYLSGAPRVSTHPDAEAGGPRSHVLGVMRAFEALDWEVKPFIMGDRVPRKWVTKGSEKAISSGLLRTLTVDLVRLFMGIINSRRAWYELGGQVDLVYERCAALQSFGWIFKQHGVPWILETSSPFFYEAKTERKSMVLTGLGRWLETRAYRECSALVCVTEALKDIIVAELGISPQKVLVVPNGVDISFFDPAKHKPKRLFEGFTLGFVATLLAWHRLDILIDTISDLRTQGLDISMVVVGDGSMRSALEAQVQELGISENVVFVGRVPWQEVPQYIAGFDLGYSGQVQMQVGKMYHSPLKLYEYMAMAKPAIASAFEDARRVISEGETGFLFEPGNKEDLKRALTLAYQLRAQLPTMGKQGRELVVATHSWEARMSHMLASIEQILGHRQ